MFKRSRVALISVTVLSLLLLVQGCGAKTTTPAPSDQGTAKETQIKVALLAEGAVNDGGWNASALAGLKQIESKLGAKVAYSEKIPVATIVEVARTYARQGYNLIYGHGFQFSEGFKTVAAEFPNVKFVVVNGSVTGANLASTNFKFGELGYFTGMTAGLVSKSGKVGVVAPMEAPTVTADIDTFKDGVKAVNPNASVTVSYVGSWDDIPKAKEAAKALLNQKNDVLLVMGNSFSIGVFQACKDANAKAIGWVTDQNTMAPETVISSGLQSVETLYMKIAEFNKNGKLEGKNYIYGINDGAQSLAPIRNVPLDVSDKVQKAITDYKDGKLKIKTMY